MNKDLNPHFRLGNVEPFLKIPLDNQIVKKINDEANTHFRKTFTIRGLERKDSNRIQGVAARIAKIHRLYRYELDVLFWNSTKLDL